MSMLFRGNGDGGNGARGLEAPASRVLGDEGVLVGNVASARGWQRLTYGAALALSRLPFSPVRIDYQRK